MRDQLKQYVNLLFAGNDDAEEIRMEILQNTLDRYDDLIDQGKSPEAAYRLAITGIGDISEILDAPSDDSQTAEPEKSPFEDGTTLEKMGLDVSSTMRAIAIGLYILCPIPLIALDSIGMDILGLCMTLAIVAAATMLIILFRRKKEQDPIAYQYRQPTDSRRTALHKSVSTLISTVGLVLYFVISFATGAWFITWVIFPLIGAVNGLVKACLDLKEEL